MTENETYNKQNKVSYIIYHNMIKNAEVNKTRGMRIATLNTLAREVFREKMTFAQRSTVDKVHPPTLSNK